MSKRIKEKTKELKKYVSELELIMPDNFNVYLNDFKTKAACERYFEKIVESIIDLAFLVIKEKGFTSPEDDSGAIDILKKENIIDNELAKKLKDAKGMRNIIIHQYGSVDDEIVYSSITEEIISDAQDFIDSINKQYKK